MTETRVIDYSYSRPKPADTKQAGYVGVMRYLSLTPGKNLTKTEAAALHKAGLAVGVVWETTATRATEGEQAGREDHTKAEQQAGALGVPEGVPIFYAVDEQTAPAKVAGYFRGVHSAHRLHPVGVYGSRTVCKGLHRLGLADYSWQTAAWSFGLVWRRCHLYQRIGHKGPAIPGGGYDENVVCNDLPMWGPHGVVVVTKRGGKAKPPKPHGPTRVGPAHRAAIRLANRGYRRRRHEIAATDRALVADNRTLASKALTITEKGGK